jgi:cytochrome c oxidase cbb3-type subunit 3
MPETHSTPAAEPAPPPYVPPVAAASPADRDVDAGHDYDGIREFDNRLPNWWLATLYIAIVFGYGYFFYYHVFSGEGLWATYKAEQAALDAAEAARPVDDGAILALAQDQTLMATKAQPLFLQQCAACHKPDGTGLIGPNLTDNFWLHGNKPSEIYNTISKGVLAKGMPTWGPVLGAEKVRTLAAYVTTLKGKNLPGRAPEGTEIKP